MPELRNRLALTATLGLLIGGSALPARAGDFLDTRVTFVFTDDDMLHGAGETTPSSPRASFGVREGRLFFFENYNRKDPGDETQTHLVSYVKNEGFIPRLTTEAALVVEFDIGEDQIGDDGSYIRVGYDLKGTDGTLDLTLFPYDTERFRLGYSYRLTWGGASIFGRNRKGPAPGAKLTYQMPGLYAFVGGKTAHLESYAPIDEPQRNNEVDSFYAGLAGFGVDLHPSLSIEVGGGYFQKGTNPRGAIRGEPVDAYGATAQLTYHLGIPLQTSVDFKLYTNDPMRIRPSGRQKSKILLDSRPRSGLGLMVSSEISQLFQTLEDPDSWGGTKLQSARAGDLNTILRYSDVQLTLDLVYRDLSFVLFNVPSFVPYQDFNSATEVQPEVWGALGLQYQVPSLHLTWRLEAGLQRPANIRAEPEAGVTPPSSLRGKKVVVVRREGEVSILPDGEDVKIIKALKLQARWDLSPSVALLAEVFYSHDLNRARLRDDQEGISSRVFEDPHLMGFGLLTQARF